MNKLCLSALLLVALIFSNAARAAMSEIWIFCDECSTKADFEQSAINWFGTRTGTLSVEVANRQTKVIYRVSLTGSINTGGDPLKTSPSTSGASRAVIGITSTTLAGIGEHFTVVNWSTPESAQTSTQFGIILKMARAEPFLVPPPAPGTYGFDSFAGALPEVLAPFLFAAMTAKYPNWQQGELGGNPLKGLMNQIKASEGKGPSICQVFLNGDVACYQLNLAAPSAIRYITGTAKNGDGESIDDGSGIGPGGGVTTEVRNVPGNPGGSRYRLGNGGSFWLFCSYHNGELVSCYVEFVAE